MRIPTLLLALTLLLAGCTRKPTQISLSDVVINHVNVVDVETGEVRPNQAVIISKGQILRVENSGKDSFAAKKYIDGTGQYLMPGLWDMHVHFRGGDTLAQANENLLPLYLAYGVTTVRDAGGDLTPHILRWRQQLDAGTLVGPRIFTSGPKIDGPGAYWPGSLEVETPAQIRRALDSLQRLPADYVKLYDSKISGEAFLTTLRQAQKRGLKTTGHMPVSVKLAEAAAAGLDATEHLYYVYKACSGKEDSLTALVRASQGSAQPLGLFDVLPAVEATYSPAAAQRIAKLLARRRTAVVPTLYIGTVLAELATADHRRDSLLAFISPKIEATYARRLASARRKSAEATAFSQRLESRFRDLVPQLQAAGVTILAGSDSGPFNSYVYPGASLQQEVLLLAQAGLTPAQALRAATINGARFMGAAGRSGSIAAGKDADLLLLSANPLADINNIKKIEAVVSRGRVYNRRDLRELVETVRNK
ncbi:amidohydrolase family protein [Hymenobacter saemangeumensis]|uniref:Amidohydrolase family protein n=1 Tax=Hymenobacter saemangeumensis TaxID=1084522 RepID=A0ABP8I6Q4_9BACT